MTEIEKSILSTVIYYDLIDRPLTNWEILRYAIKTKDKELAFDQVIECLESSSVLKKHLVQSNGFYLLKNREKIIKTRIARQKISDKKWKKIKQYTKFLQAVPYIRLVAVSGSVALNNAKKISDLDLLIITQTKRIWLCRALVTLFFHLVGQRRHHQLTQDRFCLNHYITDQSLVFTGESLYNAQTYAHLVLVLGQIDLFRKFYTANLWLKKYLFNSPQVNLGFLKKTKFSKLLNKTQKIKESFFNNEIGDKIESKLRSWQSRRIEKDQLTYLVGGRVVYNDQQLEFHPNSPERKLIENYNIKLKTFGLEELAHEKNSGLIGT